MNKNIRFGLIAIPLLAAILFVSNNPSANKKAIKPNILLIVADDLGYADLGCFGSDIETPNIDQLAKSGVIFNNFHTAPLCAPTRAMLLSGNDNHIAGMGRQSATSEFFGYEGHLTDRIATIPQVLKQVGYHTFMAGKWHLGLRPEDNPHQKGFDNSFVLLRGAGNHYNDQGIFESTPTSLYTENGQPAQWDNGNYSTDFYTDKIIEYIDRNRNNDKPFFAFAAYTSPHWPLQVDEKYWRKYEGNYGAGYEELRKERLKSLKRASIIPKDTPLPPLHPDVSPWNSLSDKQQKIEERKMELYAGMVDNLDYNIGRLINYLKRIGEYENTLIVFMSDNGAASEDFYYNDYFGPFIREHFSNEYENMGKPSSFISYGPQWAEAGSAPYKYFKGYTTEGGMVAPLIITGPGVQRKNEIHNNFTTLVDLAPTFYQIAGATYPDNFNGKKIYPLKGESMLPFLNGKNDQVHSEDYVFALEHSFRSMIRKGDWKITNISKPFIVDSFKLYNMKTDLAELHDLKDKEPEKYQELIKEWEKYKTETRLLTKRPSKSE
ncbi:arylsulfatase [Mangrovivirga sp. M17]|uniref:Arylsulfatase n=1 Tax=Mangrovivirga halotolerans TaxID=2993936 RepID=A0ABT3RV49_9BACT|nr:arylsulfatase [Mangrovivirga halotolerans]MCX2745515.1 arylsulfatase [Mangrovivirga halotolerans]